MSRRKIKANWLIVFKSVCSFAILQLLFKSLHTLYISRYMYLHSSSYKKPTNIVAMLCNKTILVFAWHKYDMLLMACMLIVLMFVWKPFIYNTFIGMKIRDNFIYLDVAGSFIIICPNTMIWFNTHEFHTNKSVVDERFSNKH